MKRKSLIAFAFVGMLGMTSCSDNYTPASVDFGDRTYINDYGKLVTAVNDLTASLEQRLDALNALLQAGLYDIKVAINDQTGAINLQTTTLQESLGTLNTTFLNGFTALNEHLDTNGNNIVNAIDSNGKLIALHLDENGKLISNTVKASTTDLISTLNSNSASLNEKLAALNTSIETGLADVSLKINNVDGSIKAQTESIDRVNGSVKAQTEQIASLAKDLVNGFNGVNSNLSTINTTLGEVNTSIASVQGAIKDMNQALGVKMDANTKELQNIVLKINDNTTAISKLSADMATELEKLNETVTAQGGKLITALNANGEVIVTALNAQGEVLKTISTGISTVGSTLDATNTKLDAMNGSLADMNTSLKSIDGSLVAVNTSLGTLNTNIETLSKKIEEGDIKITDAINDLKKYSDGIIYQDADLNADGTYDATYVTPQAWGSMDDAAKKALGQTLETRRATPVKSQYIANLNTSKNTLLELEIHAGPGTIYENHVTWNETSDSGEEVVISSTIIKNGITLFKVVKVLTYSVFEVHATCNFSSSTYLYVNDARGANWLFDGDAMGGALDDQKWIKNIRLYLYDSTTGAYCDAPDTRLFSEKPGDITGTKQNTDYTVKNEVYPN